MTLLPSTNYCTLSLLDGMHARHRRRGRQHEAPYLSPSPSLG
jgi:hypothetical protein